MFMALALAFSIAFIWGLMDVCSCIDFILVACDSAAGRGGFSYSRLAVSFLYWNTTYCKFILSVPLLEFPMLLERNDYCKGAEPF